MDGPKQIDPRLAGFKQYLEEQVMAQEEQPYSERQTIEAALKVYSDGMQMYSQLLEIPTLVLGNRELYSRPISDLSLTVRSSKTLQRLNVKTLGELIKISPHELFEVNNFGVSSLKEVRSSLEKVGLSLNE